MKTIIIKKIEIPEYLEGDIVNINISSFRRDGGHQEFPISITVKNTEDIKDYAGVAQWLRRLPAKQIFEGSSPSPRLPTTFLE